MLVIGSGPIIIGQAAEFDYAGTQACHALREEGVEVVLLNSNPATIMTDPEIADIVYIEPLTLDAIESIIKQERPDGILGTLGGQTGLNLLVELNNTGILTKYAVKALGTPVSSVEMAEDRQKFREMLERIEQPVLNSEAVTDVQSAIRVAQRLGYPVVVRPAFTLGGTGGGIAYNLQDLKSITAQGCRASPVHQVLIEKSLLGWKEVEYEVIRDHVGNIITVCNMENIDPMGVHTGDSIVVAPSQTLSDKDYQLLRTASLKIVDALDIKGGCNVQLALRPAWDSATSDADIDKDYYVIEVNPRISRSSALASKATGYPIARVASKIAIGFTLDEIANSVTQSTTAAFEPALDYCVVKIPCWPFNKFPEAHRLLDTQMKATGEVMAIDRTFEAALQKALRSLESPKTSLVWEDKEFLDRIEGLATSDIKDCIKIDDNRLWCIASALRQGVSKYEIASQTKIDVWFINAIENIVKMQKIISDSSNLTPDTLRSAKRMGFSDAHIASVYQRLSADQVRKLRERYGILPVYKMVDTCAGEFEAVTPYFYSCYEEENEALPIPSKKAIVIGSGPIRIGQGIEFDYCSVHAALTLEKAGLKSIMVNSNPETVSTDFDASTRLYFEPLDHESILDIVNNETYEGNAPPVLPQFGGQTAIDLSQTLGSAGVAILGSSKDTIDMATDRGRFEEVAFKVGLPMPRGGIASTISQAKNIVDTIGYPVIVRPSYVLGGRSMEIIQNFHELNRYFQKSVPSQNMHEILIDKYLNGTEIELDGVSDGKDVLIPGIMEHIERAGVHSGDSMSVYPTITLTQKQVATVQEYAIKIAKTLGIIGLFNIQLVATNSKSNSEPNIYILEVNPRSSRTVPFISKVTDIPLIDIAIKAMLGESMQEQGLKTGLAEIMPLIAVKAPVFSMSKIKGADTFLGPEMKSTGEVMGIDFAFYPALTKALIASNLIIPPKVAVLISIADHDKRESLPLVGRLHANGHLLYATSGTANMVRSLGIDVVQAHRRLSGNQPNVVELIDEGIVGAVVNTITGDRDTLRDGFYIRRAAAEKLIPCFTSVDTAMAAVRASSEPTKYNIKSLHRYTLKKKK